MKKCVALFAAALLAGAASAVTLSWTPKEGATEFTGFKDTSPQGQEYLVGFRGDFSVTVKFTYTGSGLPSTYFKFLTENNALGQGSLAMTDTGSLNKATITSYGDNATSVANNTGGHFAADRLDGSRNPPANTTKPMVNTLTLIFSDYDASTGRYGSTGNEFVFANGDRGTNLFDWSPNNYNFGTDYIFWQGVELGEGVVLTGITVEANDVVPEPTALALLALGVAGLALRRRVA